MLAARFHDKGDIRLENVGVPVPKAPDEVLVEVAWCGICGTDLHEYLAGPIFIPAAGQPHPLTGATMPVTLADAAARRLLVHQPEPSPILQEVR